MIDKWIIIDHLGDIRLMTLTKLISQLRKYIVRLPTTAGRCPLALVISSYLVITYRYYTVGISFI